MSTPVADPHAFLAEFDFLKKNPQFEQRPASIVEFLGPNYLNIEDKVREAIRISLVKIFGPDVQPDSISRVRRAMFTGAIGIGKTTVASIVIPYMVHWVSCLKNPQDYFGLLDGSRIAFMLMSTSENQAKQVLFGDIKARIKHSPWFLKNCMPDDDFKNQLRFPKDIWVLPGNSQETTFEGYNILGGILDEGDSHKKTKDKNYADDGWDTIHARVDSRFNDPTSGDHRGLVLAIGQMKSATGFMAKKSEEFAKDPKAFVVALTIWESLGWEKFTDKFGDRLSFWYDKKRKQAIPSELVEVIKNDDLIEVPLSYKANFINNPEKALRDLAGIPPASDTPFISLVDRIEECTERWVENHTLSDGGVLVPVGSDPSYPDISKDLYATDSLKRAAHIDIATSGDGDALGLAVGHVSKLIEIDDELKPYIVFDLLLRVKAMPGTEIILSDIRRIIYELKDDRKFNIRNISLDGFQSTDSRQQFNKRRITSNYLSVDRQLAPYYDLREAIYERRVEFPPYMTYLNRGDSGQIEIAKRELMQLSEKSGKVDHPTTGSKDVADAMAGVVYTLMGDRTYRRVARVAPDGYGGGDSSSSEPGRVDSVSFSSESIFGLSPAGSPSFDGPTSPAPIPESMPIPGWLIPSSRR